MSQFWFKQFDVGPILPSNWQDEIVRIVDAFAVQRILRPRSVTSREHDRDATIPVLTVGGRIVARELPWLRRLYEHEFRNYGEECIQEEVAIARDERYAVNINAQRGRQMRYECHVDSNPLEGLLYVTTHAPGQGGELAVANNSTAHSVADVDRDCTCIYPQSGTLVFFDARLHAHYVRPLQHDNATRIVVAMNYYTPSAPESNRPPDLNRHLFGED